MWATMSSSTSSSGPSFGRAKTSYPNERIASIQPRIETAPPGGTLANTVPSTSRSPAAASSQRATASNRGRDGRRRAGADHVRQGHVDIGCVPHQQVELGPVVVRPVRRARLARLPARQSSSPGSHSSGTRPASSSSGSSPGGSSPRIRASVPGQVVRLHQNVPRLAALARADDPAGLQQVHQPAGLREADPQLALQHRRRPELGGDDELGRLQQQVEVVADVLVDLLAGDGGGDVVAVAGLQLALDVRDDLARSRSR